MSSSKFNRNIKGRISSMASWSGGKPDEENEEPQAFGEKLRQEMEVAAAQIPIQEIELDLLSDNPYQYLARRSYDDESMQELVNSIKSNGFYGALLARRKAGTPGRLEIAYGHRRKEAAQRAGLKTIPVKVVDLGDTEMARIMASENFSRLDLDPLGEAGVVGFLAEQQNLSAREISEVVGKKRGWVEGRLALYNAPQPIKQMVEQKPETFSHVPLLLRFKNDSIRLKELVHEVLGQELTIQQLRERIEQQAGATPGATENKKRAARSSTASKEEIVKAITTSNLHGDSDGLHNLGLTGGRNSNITVTHNGIPVITSEETTEENYQLLQSQSATGESSAAQTAIETELLQLEKIVSQLSQRNPESLSWTIRSRIQRVSQILKELVGGD